ncbi:MAG: YciI family protein [Gemmataceae bacterium]
MKFAAIIEYCQDKEKIANVRPTHREYLKKLLDEGKLVVSGPITDDTGALIVYEAANHDEAEAFLQADPFHQNNIFLSYEIRPWKIVMSNHDLIPAES